MGKQLAASQQPTPPPITTPESLKTCTKSPGQLFLFDTSIGGKIQQNLGTSSICLVILATTQMPGKVGRLISRVDCNAIPQGALFSWKWTQNNATPPQTTLIQLQGTTGTTSYCMTFNTGNNFVVGDCNQPATLTAWGIEK